MIFMEMRKDSFIMQVTYHKTRKLYFPAEMNFPEYCQIVVFNSNEWWHCQQYHEHPICTKISSIPFYTTFDNAFKWISIYRQGLIMALAFSVKAITHYSFCMLMDALFSPLRANVSMIDFVSIIKVFCTLIIHFIWICLLELCYPLILWLYSFYWAI